MQCGAKCFRVEIEKEDGKREIIEVNARTPVLARKTVRAEITEKDKIVSVHKK